MIYLDTSALIKRYITETGSDKIRSLFTSQDHLATSKVAYVEVYAAFTRRKREGDLPSMRYQQVCRLFEREWPAYLVIELHDDILRLSRDLIKKHPLRGLDAIHLASAKLIKQKISKETIFGCADNRLLNSAKSEGFKLLSV
ncbi:MAG TPA: type II toxin-antitoxin system VapC family toxin [Nitrospiria bacterium]